VDAVFPESAQREAVERIAAELEVPFAGWWLTAPESVLIARVSQRRNDPSDANAAVIQQQHSLETGPVAWRSVDASLPREAVIDFAIARLRFELPEACLRLPTG
jgi:predicted kinase